MLGVSDRVVGVSRYRLEQAQGECGGVAKFGGYLMEVKATFPACQKCNCGILIPLSDYGQEGATVTYKAWACTNPECGFSLRIDKGEVSYGRKIQPKQ